jgi:hypothetical protein
MKLSLTHPFRGEFETVVHSSDETVFLTIDSGVASTTFFLTIEAAKLIAAELLKAAEVKDYE